jgi:hypothetical protein
MTVSAYLRYRWFLRARHSTVSVTSSSLCEECNPASESLARFVLALYSVIHEAAPDCSDSPVSKL